MTVREKAQKIYNKYHKKYPSVELSSVEARIHSDEYYDSWGLDSDTDWEQWFKSQQRVEDYYDSWLDY